MPVDANDQVPEKEKKGGEKKRCGLEGHAPFGIPCCGSQIPPEAVWYMERAMGFEPTTTSLGS